VSFLDVKSKSRISKEQSVIGHERKAMSTSSVTTTKFHMADRLVDALREDVSHYAIAKTSVMRESIRASHDLRKLGRNDATQRQQAGQWRHWVRFCEAQGNLSDT
jgi:hypothetical protein